MELSNHPCFNKSACRDYGRVHLPVAPRCNIQCKFCNRRFDCVNESRPGVTSGLLSPAQSMVYLESVFGKAKNISVVGIAGPGDPFANPEETLETFRRTRERYPDVLLCVATNGLALAPYVPDLAALGVTHVTVTVNAVDPAVGESIYSWVRHKKRVLRAADGARLLLDNQLAAIRELKRHGILVKINTIVIPGINEDHVADVARAMAELEVDILNCVPYHPAPGSTFAHLPEPTPARIEELRRAAGVYVPQMRHCTRCRADAVGLLGEAPDKGLMERLQACSTLAEEPAAAPHAPGRPRVAVATREGMLVNQHLGEAEKLLVYGMENGTVSLLEARKTPDAGTGDVRWKAMAMLLGDCGTLLVGGIGEKPKQALTASGIQVLEIEGLIEEAVRGVLTGGDLRHLLRRERTACGAGCGGMGMGCG